MNCGVVTSVRGSVVDARFDGRLPPIYSLLRAGKDPPIAVEVLMQLDARHVRGIALNPTQGLARGMAVEDTGGPLKAPVGKGILSRMLRRGFDPLLLDSNGIGGFHLLVLFAQPMSTKSVHDTPKSWFRRA